MSPTPEFQFIDNPAKLASFCQSLTNCRFLGFDTEFVSEDRYESELCLIQVATEDQLAIIDPIVIGDTTAFWKALSNGGHISVAHAGREEFRFCERFTGARPAQLFDVQIAAGLVGFEYPAAYSSLVSKLANESIKKGETRSDWRRRPLSRSQLDYAIVDVVHLKKIHDKLVDRLTNLDRLTWMTEEMEKWQADLESLRTEELWRRISGVATLDSKSLAVVRELWNWRDRTAKEKDQPARRILRDDLMVELARKATSNTKKIKSVRGMERRQFANQIDEIARAIQVGIELPKEKWPKKKFDSKIPSLGLLGQYLSVAMGVICRQNNLAPAIFGTTSELRQLAAWHLGMIKKPDSRLLTGWRGNIILPIVEQILAGQLALNVVNPKDDQPLSLIEIDQGVPAQTHRAKI